MITTHFISLGCPKNLVDSEIMLGFMVESGFVLTDDPAKAEVIVINTCAFIEDAKKEAIQTILEMAEFKKIGKCRLLVVAGCLPQRYKEDLAKRLPEVDVFIGAGDFHRISDIIENWDRAQELHIGKPEYIYSHKTPRMHITPLHVAYVKIAEGCFHPCSFCVVPKIRGKFRSRPMKSIVEEAKGLLLRGVKELNIIAQDTTSYGKDIGENIGILLEEISQLPGEKWIRLLYAYPHEFPDSLIKAIRHNFDICRYLDIPIQHINDRILKSMKRKGNGREVRELIERLRREIPEISIRTSLIVGYPGETQEEFDELLDFVCEMRFEHLGVFTFSPEKGTPAAALKKRVPIGTAEQRRREMMAVQRELSLGNNRKYLGQVLKILVEGYSEESASLMVARHEGQAPEVDGLVYINYVPPDRTADSLIGQFAEVEITDTHEYDLVGRII